MISSQESRETADSRLEPEAARKKALRMKHSETTETDEHNQLNTTTIICVISGLLGVCICFIIKTILLLFSI